MVTSISEVFTLSQLSSTRQNGQTKPPRCSPWRRSRTWMAIRLTALDGSALFFFAGFFFFARGMSGRFYAVGAPGVQSRLICA